MTNTIPFRFIKNILLGTLLFPILLNSQKVMVTPPFLQAGDTVAIVATARKQLDTKLLATTDLLKSWGLKLKIGSSVGLDYNQLAGTDLQRAADLQAQLDDPSVKAIWCVRGGYGTVRLLEFLNFTKFKQHPKWIIGFSDVTVLHNHLNTMGYKSIHGIMPLTLPKATPEAVTSLQNALFGKQLSYQIGPQKMNRFGTAKGELVGGNLSILYSLLGSESGINCDDKILFLEDLDEYLYHIDRMMMNLQRNGCLDSIKGIIVGSMTSMKDNEIPWGKNALEIINDVTQKYKIPVIFNFPAGHINDNRALIMGSNVQMQVNENGSSVIFE